MVTEDSFDVLILGGGMAAGRLLRELDALGYQGRVGVVSAEDCTNYNRVLLPDLVSGACTESELKNDSCSNLKHTLFLERTARKIDIERNRVELDQGSLLSYRNLVLATGGSAVVPELPGTQLTGVGALRTIAEAKALRTRLREIDDVVVIGGGLLGLEAAQAMCSQNTRVHLVHRHKHLLNRAIDEEAAGLLRTALERRGMEFHCDASPVAIEGESHVRSVRLNTGQELPADHVLFAIGTKPNVLSDEEFVTSNGFEVDEFLRCSTKNVYAIGECALVQGNRHAQVEPVFAQASALAQTLTGTPSPFVPPIPRTRLKVTGVDLLTLGTPNVVDQNNLSSLLIRDVSAGVYRRLTFAGERLLGAVLLGSTRGSTAIQSMVDQVVAPEDREALMFGMVNQT